MRRWLRRVFGRQVGRPQPVGAATPTPAERLEAAQRRLKETIPAPDEEPGRVGDG